MPSPFDPEDTVQRLERLERIRLEEAAKGNGDGSEKGWREFERRKNGGWTFWKEVWGTIIGVLTVCIPVVTSLVVYLANLDRHVAVVEATNMQLWHAQEQRDLGQDQIVREGFNRIEGSLNDIQRYLREARK